MANEAKQFTIGGVTHDVMDVGARQAIASLQNAIDAITSGDTTTAIKTFQEVIDFLDGVTDDATLIGKLNELRTLIAAKYSKPASGIPASDLADGVIPDVSGFATKTEVNAKANSADVYNKSETDAAIQEAVEGIEAGETVVINSDGANIVDGQSDSILTAPSSRMVNEIYLNLQKLFDPVNGLANIAFVGTRPTWQNVAIPTHTITLGSMSNVSASLDGTAINGSASAPEGEVTILLTPSWNNYMGSISVKDASNNDVNFTQTDVAGGTEITFILSGNVTISASASSGIQVNVSGSGITSYTTGVQPNTAAQLTIALPEHHTWGTVTVSYGGTDITSQCTISQANNADKVITLPNNLSDMSKSISIVADTVEDAHVTLAISGSNFVVKQGNTQLPNGSKVYNGSAAQTLTIEPASGYKFSTLPSADKGTMTNNGPYEASSLGIGTSVSGTLTITAAATALDTFSIDLSGITSDVGVTWNTPSAAVSTILEGSPFSVTLAKVSGTGVLNISTSTMGSETLAPNNGTIATDHVTNDITIAASVAAARMKVHSYAYPATSDSLGDCLADTEGGFNLYLYNSTTKSTFTNGGGGNNPNAAFQGGWYGNGKSAFLHKSGSVDAINIQKDSDFTLIFKDWKLSYNGNTAYNSNQLNIPFFDEGTPSSINEAGNTTGRFLITIRNYSGSPAYINSGNLGFPKIAFMENGVQNKTFASSNSGSLGHFADTQGVAHDVIVTYDSTNKKATAWVAKVINGTKTLKLTGEISVAELDINCIQMPAGNSLISGLDIYNYAMTEQEAAIATNSVIS